MSSTGRGRERNTDDTYFTRYPCALAICQKLRDDGIFGSPGAVGGGATRGLHMLEPSCGKGAFVRAMHDVFIPERYNKGLHALDISDRLLLPEHGECATRIIASDFLTYKPRKKYDAIIGNPPYSEADEHVRHAVRLLKQESHAAVCFLLRLNFLAGIERNGWSKQDGIYTNEGFYDLHAPECVYVLDKRPPFIDDEKGKNRTDSCEYGVFVWRAVTNDYEPTIRFLRWRHLLDQWEMSVEKQLRSHSGSAKSAAGESSRTAHSPSGAV